MRKERTPFQGRVPPLIFTIFAVLVISGCIREQATQGPAMTTTPQGMEGIATVGVSIPTETPARNTPTASPTFEPTPTLPPKLALEDFDAALVGYPECMLPCWAGLVPGVSRWQDAQWVLGDTVRFDFILESHECEDRVCDRLIWAAITRPEIRGAVRANADEDIVYLLRVSSFLDQEIPEYRIGQMLNSYGVPDQIYLYTSTFVAEFLGETEVAIDVILVYRSQHFMIRYLQLGTLDAETVVSCGNVIETDLVIYKDKPNVRADVWSPEHIILLYYGDGERAVGKRLRTLEESTGMSTQDFAAIFESDGRDCFETPVGLWP